MAIATKEQILKILHAYNPWWSTGNVPKDFSKEYRRFAYYEAEKRLDDQDIRRILVLTGARRVGKTTIQYQLIDRLLSDNIRPEKVLFVSLDHPMLKLGGINEILECYHDNIWPGDDCFLFFDEIQYAADWDKWLKTIYDMHPKTSIVATGSASPALIKGSSESGTGRWSVIQVPTLSFYEYCSLTGVSVPELPANVIPSNFAKVSFQSQKEVMARLQPLQKHFIRYLKVGGFPELALASSDIIAQQIMREDVVDKVLKRDIPSLYNIRSSVELERIFLYLCSISSEVVSIAAIAKELEGVSRPTVENYIRYLESANLIYISQPIEMGGKKVLKAQPKIYIADAAIRNAVLMDDEMLSDPVELGKLVETAVYKHIASFYYPLKTSVGYYRNGSRGSEVDIVVDYPYIKKILVEVKYREQAKLPVTDAICKLAKEAQSAFVITKRFDDFGIQKTPDNQSICRIPAFAFLYLLGNAERYGLRGKKDTL